MPKLIKAKPGRTAIDKPDEQLEKNALGTSDIVFMVLAASAPLAVVMGFMPITLAFGNGPGVRGA